MKRRALLTKTVFSGGRRAAREDRARRAREVRPAPAADGIGGAGRSERPPAFPCPCRESEPPPSLALRILVTMGNRDDAKAFFSASCAAAIERLATKGADYGSTLVLDYDTFGRGDDRRDEQRGSRAAGACRPRCDRARRPGRQCLVAPLALAPLALASLAPLVSLAKART